MAARTRATSSSGRAYSELVTSITNHPAARSAAIRSTFCILRVVQPSVVLDRYAQSGIGEVDAAEESAEPVIDIMIQSGFRQPSEHEPTAQHRFTRRPGIFANQSQRHAQTRRSASADRKGGRIQLVNRRKRRAAGPRSPRSWSPHPTKEVAESNKIKNGPVSQLTPCRRGVSQEDTAVAHDHGSRGSPMPARTASSHQRPVAGSTDVHREVASVDDFTGKAHGRRWAAEQRDRAFMADELLPA